MKASTPSSTTPAYPHAVRFYENDKSLSQIVAKFLRAGLAAGNPGIVIANPAQRAGIIRELVNGSSDVVQLQHSKDLVLLDAEETLSSFMTNGEPDAERFKNSMCEVIKTACGGRENCELRIYGQMVDILWQKGSHEAAIRLEILWNQLALTQAFSLLCGYAMGHFYKDANVQEVCRHHTHVIASDGEAAAVA
jgi:hypothetical protein